MKEESELVETGKPDVRTNLKTPGPEGGLYNWIAILKEDQEMNEQEFREKLEGCKDYGEVFDLVKRAVRIVLGLDRAGLMLYLGDLPLHVGAFHVVGSNGIVLNKRLVKLMSRSARSRSELNSFIFSILLHEYLHSLGYINEQQVRKLVYKISAEVFGDDHPSVDMAISLPIPRIPPMEMQPRDGETDLELIKDFERSNQSYIV